MGSRDFEIWINEARRREIVRRAILFDASLLPHRKSNEISAAMEELKMQLYEIDNEDAIEQIESVAKARLEEIRKQKDNILLAERNRLERLKAKKSEKKSKRRIVAR